MFRISKNKIVYGETDDVYIKKIYWFMGVHGKRKYPPKKRVILGGSTYYITENLLLVYAKSHDKFGQATSRRLSVINERIMNHPKGGKLSEEFKETK